MKSSHMKETPVAYARFTGLLYLIIIVFGLFSEVYVRSSLIVRGDAAATASKILASEWLFRAGFASDLVIFLCVVAAAVLLYMLLRLFPKIPGHPDGTRRHRLCGGQFYTVSLSRIYIGRCSYIYIATCRRVGALSVVADQGCERKLK